MTAPMADAELQRYAAMLLGGCVSFRRGDTLVIRSAPAHRELAVALAESAYRSGAAAVDTEVDDNRVYAARITSARRDALGRRTRWQQMRMRELAREDVAMVLVTGDTDVAVLSGLPPDRVAEDARRLAAAPEVRRAKREAQRRTICSWPTVEWATRVFPGVEAQRATRLLAKDLLSFCRVGPDDPPGGKGWTTHLATLRRRAARLTKLDLAEVLLRDRGTDLRVKIAPYSVWRGGGERNSWGRQVAPNTPTEECFISPDAAATEGTFRCSRPRSFRGRVIDGLSGEFRGGRLVRLEAKRKADRDWLARFLAAIPNADRLGEIALVDSSSRIGKTGRIYFNTLLDENAAAHMAFGTGFAKTRSVPLGRSRYGVNRSGTHLDVMIGTDDLEVVGVNHSGRRVPLINEGKWLL